MQSCPLPHCSVPRRCVSKVNIVAPSLFAGHRVFAYIHSIGIRVRTPSHHLPYQSACCCYVVQVLFPAILCTSLLAVHIGSILPKSIPTRVSSCPCSEEPDWRTREHSSGVCATRGICGHRTDGDVLNCARNEPAQPLGSEAASRKLQDVCPQLVAETNGTYCCTEEQIDTLSRQVLHGHHPYHFRSQRAQQCIATHPCNEADVITNIASRGSK